MNQTKHLYTISEVARILRKQPYQVVYVLNTGKVPEPKVRIGNRRAFDMSEVQRLCDYFYPTAGNGGWDEQ